MREIPEQEREAIRRELAEEFPNDELMQEIHYVRRIHQLETEEMSVEEKIAYYRKKAAGVALESGTSDGR